MVRRPSSPDLSGPTECDDQAKKHQAESSGAAVVKAAPSLPRRSPPHLNKSAEVAIESTHKSQVSVDNITTLLCISRLLRDTASNARMSEAPEHQAHKVCFFSHIAAW